MKPRLLLSLWRERWGKTAGISFKVPYVQGKLNQWTDWLPYSSLWSFTGMSTFALLLCTLIMFFMVGIGFSFNSQVVFSVLFICIAVYVRRYAGMLITLVLVAMAVIASTRYLYWRFDATLTPSFSLDFFVSFYFFVAECYLALLVFTGLVQSIWPLRRTSADLPSDSGQWPTVDVFILCDGQSYAAIKLTTLASNKLNWPRKKLKIYLIDGVQRDDLSVLAASIGAHYLSHSDTSNNRADFVNLSLPSTSGEFVVVFESGQAPAHRFLQSTVGWFLRDQKLALIQTPHHFSAPSHSHFNLEITSLPEDVQPCALIRRSTIVQMGGFETAVATHQSHLALTLQASGYTSAYLGFNRYEKSPAEDHDPSKTAGLGSDTVSEVFVVEHPFVGRSLLWKQRIASFHHVLEFYYPVPRLFFFVAPVVYLLGHIQIIQTSPDLLVAYVIPHFIHGYIARNRMDENKRFKIFTDIREAVLAWYILIPTTLTLVQTQFKQFLSLWSNERLESTKKPYKSLKTGSISLFSPTTFLPYLFVLSLNLAGFLSGLADRFFFNTNQQGLAILCLLWTAYNLMLLTAMLAVAQEASQVLRHTSLRQHLLAMIKLPSGRTLSCTTENFPASILEVSLPIPVAVSTDTPVSLSILHAHRELVLSATVVIQQGLKLDVRIAAEDQKNYQLFATTVLSRGSDWPKWLPGQNADRPLPKWVSNTVISVSVAILDFVTNISKHLHWMRLSSWIQLWRKDK